MVDPFNDPAFAEQVPINQAIVEALIESIPDDWEAAQARLTWEKDPDGGALRVQQEVANPQTGDGWTVSEELIAASERLNEHRDKFKRNWTKVVYSVESTPEGQWKCGAKFD